MKKQLTENSTVLLRGTITALEKSRRSHDFVMTKVQHQQMDATAIVASAMGMGSTAIGLISMAGDAEEEADWVEFHLDGKQMQGWLWSMPMQNGDHVEVVAEPLENNRYVVYAIKRDSDELLAVYPHATAGRKAHYRKSVKTWMWCFGLAFFAFVSVCVMQEGFSLLLEQKFQFGLSLIFGFSGLIYAIIAFRVSRKFLGFVRIAETIFSTFGWPDVRNIDLRKTSREYPSENQLRGYGNFYFRYKQG